MKTNESLGREPFKQVNYFNMGYESMFDYSFSRNPFKQVNYFNADVFYYNDKRVCEVAIPSSRSIISILFLNDLNDAKRETSQSLQAGQLFQYRRSYIYRPRNRSRNPFKQVNYFNEIRNSLNIGENSSQSLQAGQLFQSIKTCPY